MSLVEKGERGNLESEELGPESVMLYLLVKVHNFYVGALVFSSIKWRYQSKYHHSTDSLQ